MEDPYEVSPIMLNPFDPPNLIYWLICPTHQVCKILFSCYLIISLRNALHSSEEGGTKTFTSNQSQLGWSTITHMYNRECE